MEINKLSVKLIRESGVNYSDNPITSSPQGVVNIMESLYNLRDEPIENFIILMLDTKNKIIGSSLISRGTVNSTLISPRNVFQTALLGNAVNIILVHNHPSGNTEPSKEDKGITRRLVDGGKLLGIGVLDHIIIGDGRYTSLKQEGML